MPTLINKILAKIFWLLKNANDEKYLLARTEQINSVCLLKQSTIICSDAIIQNATGDKNKIKIGTNSWIRGYLLVYNHGGIIEIGDDCFVGPCTRIWAAKKIIIGNRVLIAHNVNIHDNNSHPLNSKLRHMDFLHILKDGLQFHNDLRESDIIIEDDVWIGFNSTIMKGVKIGKAAIIGANTNVNFDVPDYAVVVGNPAKIIKYTN